MSSRKPTIAKTVTVKQATFDLLRAFGIKKVFGNPGSTELPFLSDWPYDIDYVLGLQEASVVGMADGYAQATRNAGFVNLHSAAGVGNALGNIYTAHRNQTPLVITAGQQARSILPLQAFLQAERASEFPRPYVKYSVEPARAEDVPAAIARAYYTAMQPPCGPTFVSVPIDDWTHSAQAVAPRKVSREIGPDPEAMKQLVAALATSKHPALVVGPGIDRAEAVDLMVKAAEKTKAAVWVSPFSARCSFPERHPQFAGFLHASPGQLSDALRSYDLVVVIGAPVFTFHVEGHASIFDGATAIFQITDDPTAAAVTPAGTSIVATMKPALSMLLELLPETGRAAPEGRRLPPAPHAADPIPVEFLMHSLAMAMPDDAGAIQRDQHFKARRDKNLSPLEDESGDGSGVWDSIKQMWCYSAEDEADDWWVAWGMLRLRSQQTELNFGMELQVNQSPFQRSSRLMHSPEHSTFPRSRRPIIISFEVFLLAR